MSWLHSAITDTFFSRKSTKLCVDLWNFICPLTGGTSLPVCDKHIAKTFCSWGFRLFYRHPLLTACKCWTAPVQSAGVWIYPLHTTNATDYHTSSFHYIKLFRFSGICVSAVQHCISTFMTVKPLNILTRDGGVWVCIGVKAQDVLKETISSR